MVRFYVYRVKGTCCLPMFMGQTLKNVQNHAWGFSAYWLASHVTIDWPIDHEFFSLTFIIVPDAHYVSVFAHQITGDYDEENRDPITKMPNRVLFF